MAKKLVDPGWAWDDKYTLSQGVIVGDLFFVAGLGPIDPEGSLIGKGDIKAQTRQVFDNMKAILEAGGASMADVVNLSTFLTDINTVGAVHEVRAEYFKKAYPASASVEAGDLAFDGMMIEVDAVAVIGDARAKKRTIDPGWAWDDQYIFSQAVDIGDFVFVSGQAAVDPAGNIVGKGDIKAQTRQILENMQVILQAAGSDLADVVKMNWFYSDVGHLKPVHEIRGQCFKKDYPTGTGVKVRRYGLEGMLLEVDAIAVKGAASTSKKVVDPGWPWDDQYIFSQGIAAGGLLFVSGQGAFDTQGNLVGKGDIKAQTKQVFDNLKEMLRVGGATFDDLVQIHSFFPDIKIFAESHEVRANYLTRDYPASRGVGVDALAFEGMLLEVDVIAALK